MTHHGQSSRALASLGLDHYCSCILDLVCHCCSVLVAEAHLGSSLQHMLCSSMWMLASNSSSTACLCCPCRRLQLTDFSSGMHGRGLHTSLIALCCTVCGAARMCCMQCLLLPGPKFSGQRCEKAKTQAKHVTGSVWCNKRLVTYGQSVARQ